MIQPLKELEHQIPLSEYVSNISTLLYSDEIGIMSYVSKVDYYNNFIRQDIALGMFVPTTRAGKVLKPPIGYTTSYLPFIRKETCKLNFPINNSGEWLEMCNKYQRALNRIIFEGFELIESSHIHSEKHLCLVKSDNVAGQVYARVYSDRLEWKFPILGAFNFETIEDLQELKLKFKHYD